MVIFLPDQIALHDTTNGQVIWQKQHGEDVWSFWKEQEKLGIVWCNPTTSYTRAEFRGPCVSLFTTNHVTGYVFTNEYHDYLQCQPHKVEWKLILFSTATGELIGTEHDVSKCMAKGPYVCYPKKLAIHVLEVSGTVVKKHKFKFPLSYFMEDMTSCHFLEDRKYIQGIELIGYLDKSNILLGNLAGFHCSILFSLDLDSAVNATNKGEQQMAFSLPLAGERISARNHTPFQAVYRTDRINECVDLVGVMRKRGRKAVKTYYFVTEMQCSGEPC